MKVRKVAWMLLRNASVQSLANGVLTVRFGREGDVKGFTASGCGADLERVLAESFGLKVAVKAVVSAAPAGRDPGSAPRNPENSYRTVATQPSSPTPAPAEASQPPAPPEPPPPPPPPRAPQDSDDGDPFDVNDPDASVGEADLTGMDLIKRELGGQIIDEIDNS
jgi:DNA polymerase-3 subunit gamma/tau